MADIENSNALPHRSVWLHIIYRASKTALQCLSQLGMATLRQRCALAQCPNLPGRQPFAASLTRLPGLRMTAAIMPTSGPTTTT